MHIHFKLFGVTDYARSDHPEPSCTFLRHSHLLTGHDEKG
jgi:hypothetical protein